MVDIAGVGAAVSNINFALFGSEPSDIDAIAGVADIYHVENHNFSVKKTEYPVEDGSNRTDNAVTMPEKLVMQGVVSNLQPFVFGLVNIADKSRTKEAWGRIREWKNNREPTRVVSLLGIYENMLILEADATLNKDTGQALEFTIILEEIQIGETETVKLAPAKLSESADTKASDIPGGLKQALTPGAEKTTLLKDLVKGVSGIFN